MGNLRSVQVRSTVVEQKLSARMLLVVAVLGFSLAPLAGSGAPFVRGDVDDDGSIDVSDALSTLSYLFAGGPLACLDAGDANDSGAVDIADAVYLLSHLLVSGPAPPAPFDMCGPDPTDDTLPPCQPRRQCPVSYDWHHYKGHKYALTRDHCSWLAAEEEAVALGGHLVTVNDAEENSWLTTTFGGTYGACYSGNPWASLVWIGYELVDGQWVWVSGEPVIYQGRWWSGSPVPLDQNWGPHGYLHPGTHPSAGTWWNADHDSNPCDWVQGIIEVPLTVMLPGGVPLEMIWCPPGTFMMGSPMDEPGRTQVPQDWEWQDQVTLTHGFWLGRYEVTRGERAV